MSELILFDVGAVLIRLNYGGLFAAGSRYRPDFREAYLASLHY